jgi:hypothetical protein
VENFWQCFLCGEISDYPKYCEHCGCGYSFIDVYLPEFPEQEQPEEEDPRIAEYYKQMETEHFLKEKKA